MASWYSFCNLASYVRRLEKRVGKMEKKEREKEKKEKDEESNKSCPDGDSRWEKAAEIVATIRHDIAVLEANLEESKVKITTAQNSLDDCFNEVLNARDELEQSIADVEERIPQMLREVFREATAGDVGTDSDGDPAEHQNEEEEEENDDEDSDEDSDEHLYEYKDMDEHLYEYLHRPRNGKGTGECHPRPSSSDRVAAQTGNGI